MRNLSGLHTILDFLQHCVIPIKSSIPSLRMCLPKKGGFEQKTLCFKAILASQVLVLLLQQMAEAWSQGHCGVSAESTEGLSVSREAR